VQYAVKKIYIISGERSGDMHAGNLVLALKGHDSKLQFRGMGGSYSKDAGVHLALDYASVSVMGFLEVVFGFRKVLKALALVKKDLIAFRPDALILVDFGGFNMKIAAFAKEKRRNVPWRQAAPSVNCSLASRA
jgi:lipid-A-disaccharide synthase